VQPVVVNFSELASREQTSAATAAPAWIAPSQPLAFAGQVPPGAAPALKTPLAPSAPLVASPAPSSSFMALDDNNYSIPPDTHGAVGPNHLMTTLNSQVRIQNRSGGVISTVSLNSFWSGVAPGAATFDPKIFYDPYGQRWIFVTCANSRSANSAILIGASQTSDPTGNWNLYMFDVDASNLLWFDYPSLGFNKDWVVLNGNFFSMAGAFDHSSVYVFTKSTLYSGGALSFRLFALPSTEGGVIVPAVTYDNSLATLYLLQDWNGNTGGAGYLKLRSITGSVGAEALNALSYPSTLNTWYYTGGTGDFAPQLGSAQKIQNNDSRMQNVNYRNGSLWATHTVFLPAVGSTRAAVQWWEINPASGGVNQLGRIDDASGATFYAFPSIAVNKDNDVLLGYSRFSAAQYASANYAYRDHTDPASTVRADTVLKAGEAPYYKTYTGTKNRWGDYSHTVVDPVNDTDLWTIQEYAYTPGGGYDRWSTWWGKVVPPAAATYTISGQITLNAAGLAGVTVSDGAGHTALTDGSGSYTLTGVPAGTYTVTPSLAEYTFTPPTQSVTVGPSKSGINFTATRITYTVAGRITLNGVGLAAVTVSDGAGHTGTTNPSGDYIILGMPSGTYTITPSLAEYTFTPPSQSVTVGASKTGINFTATRITYTVSGQITLSASGLAGVTVSDGAGHSALTDGSGNYTITGMPSGSYTITPSLAEYTFTPPAQAVTVGASKTGINFAATRITYTISGRITISGGFALVGVTVSDGAGHTALTNASGDYTISGVPSGTYTITPSLAGSTFTPPTRSVTVGPSRVGVDFVGTTPLYSISGKVTSDGTTGIAGVLIIDNLGRSTVTAANGSYTLTGLPAGSYTLIPFKVGRLFTPKTQPVTITNAIQLNVNFVGAAGGYGIYVPVIGK
jgi:hypothetical protein